MALTLNQIAMSSSAAGQFATKMGTFHEVYGTAKNIASSTVRSTANEVKRNASNTVADGDTSKVTSTTLKTIAPGATLVGVAFYGAATQGSIAKFEKYYKDGLSDKGFIGNGGVQADFESVGIHIQHAERMVTGGLGEIRNVSHLTTDKGSQLFETISLPKSFEKKGTIVNNNHDNTFTIIDVSQNTAAINQVYKTYVSSAKHEMKEFMREQEKLIKADLSVDDRKGRYKKNEDKIHDFQKKIKGYKKGANIAEQIANENAKYQRLRNPKTFMRQNLRLASTPLQGNEVMQGYNMGQTLIRVPITVTTVTGNLATWAGFEVYKLARTRRVMKVSNLAFKNAWYEAGKGFGKVTPFKGNTATRLLRNRIKEKLMMEIWNQSAKGSLSHALVNIAKAKHYAALNNKSTSVAIRNAIKTAAKGSGTGAKVAQKIEKTVMFRATEAVSNRIAVLSAKFANTSFGQALGAVLGKLKDVASAVSTVFSTFAKILLSIALGVAAFLLLLYILDGIVHYYVNLTQYSNGQVLGSIKLDNDMYNAYGIYTLDDTDKSWENLLERRGNKIMDRLEIAHSNMQTKLNNIRAKYDVSDTQYPSGSLENYKEIFCATEVMCGLDFDNVTNAELQEWVDVLYEQTHIITEEPYTFTYADGTEGTACHIYVDIQHDELLAYEAMLGVAIGGDQVHIDAASCPKGTVTNEDWMNVVRTIKTLMAQTQASYNQSTYVPINVNGTVYNVRTDCSGYVTACLIVNGAAAPGSNFNSQSLINVSNIPGFTKYAWSGWNNLQEGDIISYGSNGTVTDSNGITRYGWSGHTEIFSHNDANGNHYVYSCGSTNTLRSAVPTRSGGHAYSAANTVVWRPNSPGSISGVEISDVVESEESSILELYKPFYDYNGAAVVLFSNTADVIFNEETGNEDGYDTALQNSVEIEQQYTELFTNNAYDTTSHYSVHSLKTDGVLLFDKVSSYDFIRYILAKHGVSTPTNYLEISNNAVLFPSRDDIQAGDIIYYVPNTADVLNLTNAPRKYSVGSSGYELYIKPQMIPMICVGDGLAAAYSKDLTKEGSEYTSSTAQIRIYDIETELNELNIMNVYRFNGYVIDPVFGQSGAFAGWTDYNVKTFIGLLKGEQWVSEEFTVEVEDLFGGTSVIDYSTFYYEQLFDGNLYISTDAHTQTFKNDILSVALKYYDQYGILPSIAYTHSFVVSENRSTEESLVHFNIFEKYSSNEDGFASTKFSYDENGDVIAKDYIYMKFDSYLDAYRDLSNTLRSGQYGSGSILFKESFNSQLSAYANYNMLNSAARDKMKSIYNNQNSELSEWDENAVLRKKAIDKVISTSSSLEAFVNKTQSDTRSEYYALNGLIRDVSLAISDLEDIITQQDSATERTDTVLADANTVLASGELLAAAKWNWYNNNRTHPSLFEYADCREHCYGDWVTEEVKDALGQPIYINGVVQTTLVWDPCVDHVDHGRMTTLSAAANCGNASYTYQTWIHGHCE